jgi:hypothetical protein
MTTNERRPRSSPRPEQPTILTSYTTSRDLTDRYQQTKTRIGKQRGAKVAQIDLARRLSEAIWHMLTRNEPFAPKGATDPLAA